MKKLFLVILISLKITGADNIIAQDYFIHSLSEARKRAKEENKFIFVDFSAVWCGPCKMMEKYIFPDSEVKDTLTSKFICVELLQGKNKATFSRYRIKSFPTFIIMDEEGNEIYRFSGASDKKAFLDRLNAMPNTETDLEKYDSLYIFNKKNIQFLNEYYIVLLKNKYKKKAKKIAKRILKLDKDWSKKSNMEIILRNLDVNKNYKYLLKHKQQFYDSFPPKIINEILFIRYFNTKSSKDYIDEYINIKQKKKDFNKLFNNDTSQYYLNRYFFYVLKDKEDLKLKQIYITSALKYLQKDSLIFRNKRFYNQIMQLIYKIKDTTQLIELEKAFEFQFSGNDEDVYIKYFDLWAFVNYKLDNKDKAVSNIKRANEISVKKTGKPFKSNLQLLISLDKNQK